MTTHMAVHKIVVGTDHTSICLFTFFIPSMRFTAQKRLSLKYENTIAPKLAAYATKVIFTSNPKTMRAEIEAPVIIAKVPLPCISFTMLEITERARFERRSRGL